MAIYSSWHLLYGCKILGGAEDEEKEKEVEKEYKELCDWMKRNLGDKVAKVQISKRISSSPCVLVSGKFGWSANMERYMRLSWTLNSCASLSGILINETNQS